MAVQLETARCDHVESPSRSRHDCRELLPGRKTGSKLGAHAVDCHDGLRHCSEPSPIWSEAVGADGFAPCSVVIASIAGRALFLHDDPSVDGEDAAPSHGAGGENPDHSVGAGSRSRQWRSTCRPSASFHDHLPTKNSARPMQRSARRWAAERGSRASSTEDGWLLIENIVRLVTCAMAA